ncbi:DUF2007 domain-containing protein [Siphonobacter sp.]|uniref:DUF2007 domain-containing protein n=1 Tax=Siphonobacter sp. TaxID=1869184 RepID=UPI003B3A88F4
MPWRVELVKGWLLDEYEIEGVVLSKQDRSYLFGHCELHVPVKDAAFAEFIIQHEEKNTDQAE